MDLRGEAVFCFFAYKDRRNSFSKSDGCFIHGASGGGVCSAARAAASQARRDKGRAEQRGVQRGAGRSAGDKHFIRQSSPIRAGGGLEAHFPPAAGFVLALPPLRRLVNMCFPPPR